MYSDNVPVNIISQPIYKKVKLGEKSLNKAYDHYE